MDGTGVYTLALIDEFVKRYLAGSGRETLDPMLDGCVAVYLENLDEDGQVEFKGRAKACRMDCVMILLSPNLPRRRPTVRPCDMMGNRPAIDQNQADEHLRIAWLAIAAVAIGANLRWPFALEIG